MKHQIRQKIPNSILNALIHLPKAITANFWFGFPSKKLKIIGVTGTDGKTTTVSMIHKILLDSGKKASMLSTIAAVIAGQKINTGYHVTTPNPFILQKMLKSSVEHGDEFFVLEVTSHALDQFRVWGINFEIGIITNITPEHLDYHKTFENYFNAKAKLIENAKAAILNKDDPSFEKLSRLAKKQVISYSLYQDADFNPQIYPIQLQIPGEYNIYNALAAGAASSKLGIDFISSQNSLAEFGGVPGRMEEIKNNRNIRIFVDFAHTPNALEQSLKALKSITDGKLIAVFGASAERDKYKRPLMGKVAASLADTIILTDDDPRFEDRNKIINEIAEGALQIKSKHNYQLLKQPDRGEAIKTAIHLAKEKDVVGIFGKGHEQSMSFKGIEKEWSDQMVILSLLDNNKIPFSYTPSN